MEKEQYPICSCGKVSFPSQRVAKETINFIKGIAKKKVPKRVYYSKECLSWHVTSEKNKKNHDQ